MGRRSIVTTTTAPTGQASECTNEATKASPFTGLTLLEGAELRTWFPTGSGDTIAGAIRGRWR